MPWRPHGRAEVDPNNPRAFSTCDRCGFNYNRQKLQYQMQWGGAVLVNTGLLVCDMCLDQPSEFLRAIILPPDPMPVYQPRIERYAFDEMPAAIETGTGRATWQGWMPTLPVTGTGPTNQLLWGTSNGLLWGTSNDLYWGS